MKPGSPEAMELARALLAAVDHADHDRRRADRLEAAHAMRDRYQLASLIFATLAGAAAALAAVLPMVQP
ncbi:MAG: hypothetical protein C0434_12810 [Xanthomonadaceae bacterium]|nr:hypothetical protein [Xanthomonadaceae bacterium]